MVTYILLQPTTDLMVGDQFLRWLIRYARINNSERIWDPFHTEVPIEILYLRHVE